MGYIDAIWTGRAVKITRVPFPTTESSNPHKPQKYLWVLIRSSMLRNPIWSLDKSECKGEYHQEKDLLFQTELTC